MFLSQFPPGITVEVIDVTSPYFGKQGKALHPIGESLMVEFSEEDIAEIPFYQLSLAD